MQRRIISCATWARRQQKPPSPPKKTDGISDDNDNGENLARLIRRGVCVVLYSRVPSSPPPQGHLVGRGQRRPPACLESLTACRR